MSPPSSSSDSSNFPTCSICGSRTPKTFSISILAASTPVSAETSSRKEGSRYMCRQSTDQSPRQPHSLGRPAGRIVTSPSTRCLNMVTVTHLGPHLEWPPQVDHGDVVRVGEHAFALKLTFKANCLYAPPAPVLARETREHRKKVW